MLKPHHNNKMKNLSLKNIDLIPPPIVLKKRCQSIAVLEAIICQEWEYRYYSYNKNWDKEAACCQMRNGSGDEMLILFQQNGAIINGFTHESPVQDKGKITQNLPNEFHEFMFTEPVKSIGTTFCIWNIPSNSKWTSGIHLDNTLHEVVCRDSESLLQLLDGNPETFHQWAMEYYELVSLNLNAIQAIYQHAPITNSLINQLTSQGIDFKTLKEDLNEIGYSYIL